jgi:uncharacterized protein YcnI
MSLRRTSLRTAAISTTALALAIAAPLAASAHVTAAPSSTAAGSYSVVSFSVPHGCSGSPTTKVTLNLPSSIVAATPTVNANWTIDKVKSGDNVTAVTYTAKTPLAADQRDVLALQVQLPKDAAGQTLAFPVLQECVTGSTNWNEPMNADGTEPAHPAPTVTVTAASATDDTMAMSSTADNADNTARILGISGLIVGVVGIVVAVVSRRKAKQA